MSELMQKAYNTVEEAFLEKGDLVTSDIPPELLAYLREGLTNVDEGFVSDGKFPFPLPEFFNALEVRGNTLRYSDYVYINIPEEDFDAGDIPEVEYTDSPFLDAGPLSSRRYNRLKGEINSIYGYSADRTSAPDIAYEADIPEKVKQDPLGADYTTGRFKVKDE